MRTGHASSGLIRHAAISTPVGLMHVYAGDGGLLTLVLPNESRADAEAVLLRRLGHGHKAPASVIAEDDGQGAAGRAIAAARAQLDDYFAGRLQTFELPLDPPGTPFQRLVWSEVATIPFGQTRSYAEVARSIGRPAAVRAVGAANGANPLPLIIPCHRVVGSDGSLTGYGGGLPLKERLLALEQS